VSGQYEELARTRVAMMFMHTPARMLDFCAPEHIGVEIAHAKAETR
jgi:hypothetical protein